MPLLRLPVAASLAAALIACTPGKGVKPGTEAHIKAPIAQNAPTEDIPPPVTRSLSLPVPRAQARPETYSVVVNNVKVQELLFALARDARVNVDVHPGVVGTVTLNALDQTLPQLLTRISRQVDMRFELDGPNLVVMPDLPFLRSYKIDYVNLTRETSSSVAVTSQIATAGSGARAGSQRSESGAGNSSATRIENSSKNRFWETLIGNLRDLLRETDKVLPPGASEVVTEYSREGPETAIRFGASKAEELLDDTRGTTRTVSSTRQATYREAASVIANPETGVISVRATARQHERVQEFLDRVMTSAKRQVLIEATIAEVTLSENYQQGIEWSVLNLFDTGLRVVQKSVGGIVNGGGQILELGYTSRGGNFDGAVKLLESFGNVRVLSSPKLSVMNNQTAVMKVVDDNIYFTYEKEEREATPTTAGKINITSTVHSVPVGLVLTVTPLVGDDDAVTLNVRPSLSRVIGQKEDPSLEIILGSGGSLKNTIPIIRAREFDSVMRIGDGNIAVMGGLMEDMLDLKTDSTPGASSIPFFGALFQNRNDLKRKTELVIFIRPTVIRAADSGVQVVGAPRADFFDERIGPPLVPPLPGDGNK